VITLGLDPGERRENPTGWAVIDFDRPLEAAIIAAGVLRPPVGAAWETRIAVVVAEVPALLSRYAVSYMACEDAYLGKNPQTFRQLLCFGWETRVLARQTGCPFVLVNPANQAQVRLSLPAPITDAALAHLPVAVRPHALSAIAIAWHGAGLLRRQRAIAAA
jgi:hypothetical protein